MASFRGYKHKLHCSLLNSSVANQVTLFIVSTALFAPAQDAFILDYCDSTFVIADAEAGEAPAEL